MSELIAVKDHVYKKLDMLRYGEKGSENGEKGSENGENSSENGKKRSFSEVIEFLFSENERLAGLVHDREKLIEKMKVFTKEEIEMVI